MTKAWVIGAGGLLGSALVEALERERVSLYRHKEAFYWQDAERISCQFDEAAESFLQSLSEGDDWALYWAAGIGTMGTDLAAFDAEKASLSALLSALSRALAKNPTRGTIGFASSAGALYSMSCDFLITEESEITITTDYARAKFVEENLLQEFVEQEPLTSLVVARFSTLYGPGQAKGKRQGLLSHLVRSALRQTPVEIFVPLDTARDYILAADAAGDFIASMAYSRDHGLKSLVRIIAAEQSVTISEVIGTLNRILKRRVRVVLIRNGLSALYTTRIAYRSLSRLPEAYRRPRHSLIEGVSILLYAERKIHVASAFEGVS